MRRRTTGRKWMALREHIMRRDKGLCVKCKANGRISLAQQVDHIEPLHRGGTDDPDNLQSLCLDCHEVKTAGEAAHFGSVNHPDWLERSSIPLTIVCGPPASGKSTYVDRNAEPFDFVIDLDGIISRLEPCYKQWQGSLDKGLLNRAVRQRNAMLGSLKRQKRGRAWFIVSAPSPGERDWWASKLGGDVVLLDPGADECKRRAIKRGTPRALDGIDRWYSAAAKPWVAPARKQEKRTYGADGWPI